MDDRGGAVADGSAGAKGCRGLPGHEALDTYSLIFFGNNHGPCVIISAYSPSWANPLNEQPWQGHRRVKLDVLMSRTGGNLCGLHLEL
jgi:hypothetical protein